MVKVTTSSALIILLVMMTPVMSYTQRTDLNKADKLYKERAYNRAIPLYETGLREKFKVSVAQKLAQSYRLTNQWVKAEALLDTLVLREKVREDMWFLYGEALMSNGKYEEARSWFLKYAQAMPEDSLALDRAEACLKVADIIPVFGDLAYQPMPFNSESDDHAAIPWKQGIVFTSDRSPGLRLLQEKSSWTGRHYLSLFYTEPLGDSTWTTPTTWTNRLNEQNLNAGYAVFSPDSSEVWFTRNTLEPNERGVYPLQIYSALRIGEERWSRPEAAPFAQPAFNMMHPAISPDGKWMAYASDRAGGQGGLDLWLVECTGGKWGRPFNPGPPVNTPAHDAFPFFAHDGRLFFASKGHIGFGGYDLFVTHLLADGRLTQPYNLGPPLNSPLDDITFYLYPDGKRGYFSSTRDGGDDDLYFWWQRDAKVENSESQQD